MRALYALADVLARDVAPWGGLSSPVLCWLGAVGLVGLFVWQAVRLLSGVRRAAEPFALLRPRLRELADRVEATDLGRAYDRAFTERRPTVPALAEPETADLDRLRELDQAMREVEAFRRPWIRFRKTVLIEHVPWFKEPRVFSTRSAEDFFTTEAVLGGRVDLAFFAQVPSLITGMGLLLTFVAICIGLSRLHADGQTIAGISGLINGLAGKFLTSIVGLICANLFLLLERPAVRLLLQSHGEFLALLDESFPRRTAEDLLDELRRAQSRGRDGQDTQESLAGAMRALAASQNRAQAQIAALMERLGVVVTALSVSVARGGRHAHLEPHWEAEAAEPWHAR